MSGTLTPGQSKNLTVSFTDANNVVHPLQSVPTCVDPTGTLSIAPVGNQTVNDPTFSWTIAAPSSVTVGADLPVTLSGTNPDGTVDTSQFDITISALDDTVVNVVSFQ